MENEDENIAKVEKPDEVKLSSPKQVKKKRKIFRKIFLSLFILFIAILIFIQTSFFKNWLLQYGVDKVNVMLAEKDSRLYIEKLEGSVVKDVKLINISLVVKKDTLFKLDMLELAYDLPRLLKKEVKIKNIFSRT